MQLRLRFSNIDKKDFVGYIYRGGRFDFFLPKIYKNHIKEGSSKDIKDAKLKSIVESLPWWIYRVLDKYMKQKGKDEENKKEIYDIRSSKIDNKNYEPSIIERILSLKDFYDNNRDLFLFIYRQAHLGFNRINWVKTVRKYNPIINNGKVVYLNVDNHKKFINYDEQLLVIFFNTLVYLNDEMGLPVVVDQPYNLYGKDEFKRMIENGQVLGTLRRIKNNYFNDKMRLLWELLYAYYCLDFRLRADKQHKEYLYTTSFENVFECIMDYMLSDDDLITEKNQNERIIDHLFAGKSIFEEADKVCYIADSKYYMMNSEVGENSDLKQFSYARNLITHAMENKISKVRGFDEKFIDIAQKYRDDKTEGYVVTPNFYVRPNSNVYFYDDEFELHPFKNEKVKVKRHFDGRLFDRDTLFLMQYTVNLLYVMQCYAKNDIIERNRFRSKVETKVACDLNEHIKNNGIKVFRRWFSTENELDDFIGSHFRSLIGRMFSRDNCLIVALAESDDKLKEFTDNLEWEPHLFFVEQIDS